MFLRRGTFRKKSLPKQKSLYASGILRSTLGPELFGTWTNHATHGYETFTLSDQDIAQAINTTGWGICYDTFEIENGDTYQVEFDFTLNSGTVPVLWSCTGTDGQNFVVVGVVTDGHNKFTYTSARAGTEYIMFYTTNGQTNDFACSNFTLKKVLK